MFRRRTDLPIDVTRLSSLIGAGVEIAGDVLITDGVRIDGKVEGIVQCKDDARGLLVLSESGTIVGGARVHDAVINGTVRGDLQVENFLELQAGARVTGNIRYRQLRIECGATVDGKLEHMADGTATSAVSSGNVVTLTRAHALTGSEHESTG